MAFTAEESREFRTGLSLAQKHPVELEWARCAVRTGTSLTEDIVDALGTVGFPHLFAVGAPVGSVNARDRASEVNNLLAKSRTGRHSVTAAALTDLIGEMSKIPALDPGDEGFWGSFFMLQNRVDERHVDSFVAELAAGYGVVRMILRSDLDRKVHANQLGHVDMDTVVERLGYRGISVVPDLPKPTFEAVRATGLGLLTLIRPDAPAGGQLTFGAAGHGRGPVAELTLAGLNQAVAWCDSRGTAQVPAKTALVGLRTTAVEGISVGTAVTAYLLQLVAEQRNAGLLPASIRKFLVSSDLDDEGADRLLNERSQAAHAYPWGVPDRSAPYRWQ